MQATVKQFGVLLLILLVCGGFLLPVVVVDAQTGTSLPEAGFAPLTDFDTTGEFLDASGNSVSNKPSVFIGNLIRGIIALLGVVMLLFTVYAGFLWMTAGGNAEQVDKAKGWVRNGAIGLLIVFTSFAIATFVVNSLGSVAQIGGVSLLFQQIFA